MHTLLDAETRPAAVASALNTMGAETVLNKIPLINGNAEKVVFAVASMTTVQGLIEKKAELSELAAPYIAEGRLFAAALSDAEGRKDLADEMGATKAVADGRSMLDERVLKPLGARINAGKELAAPYVSSVKTSAPYVALEEALRRSERVEAMVQAFHAAREHPVEKVTSLREKAVDLIKYDKLKTYRDRVMSEQFQADTARLVKEDLPALARRGAQTVKARATTLAGEIEAYKEKLIVHVGAAGGEATRAQKAVVGYIDEAKTRALDRVPTHAELVELAHRLKTAGRALASELSSEMKLGSAHIAAEGLSVPDILERLKRVVSVVDRIVIELLIATVKTSPTAAPADASTCDTPSDADADLPLPPPAERVPSASVTDDEEMEMKDAIEDLADPPTPSKGSEATVDSTFDLPVPSSETVEEAVEEASAEWNDLAARLLAKARAAAEAEAEAEAPPMIGRTG